MDDEHKSKQQLIDELRQVREELSILKKTPPPSELETVRATFNGITDSVLIHPLCDDGFAPFIEVNDTACKKYGYSKDEFLSLTAIDITHPSQTKHHGAHQNKNRVRQQKSLIFETIHVTKSGEKFPVEINASVIPLGGKKTILSVVRDISDRKKIEESLRISKFSLDKACIGAYCLNPSGNIYNVNDEAARMLGYTKEELESLCLFDIDPTVTCENYDAIWQVLASKGANHFESVHLKKDGTALPVEIHANLLEYEGKQYSIAFSKDISERKEAEKELQRNMLRLQTLYNTLPVVIWVTDKEGKFILSEGSILEKMGHQPGDLVGLSVFEVYKDYPTIIEHLRHCLEGHFCEYETEVNGIHFHTVLTPLWDDQKTVSGVNALSIEVTEKVRMQEMMVQSEKMLSVGGLAAGMAHEINNPLAGMLQMASSLSHRLVENPRIAANQKIADQIGISMADIEEYMKRRDVPRMLQLITESGNRVSEIIKNMLHFSRKSETIVSSHDLRELMDKTLQLAQTDFDFNLRWDFRDIKITKDYASDVMLVPCEEVKIQQVLLNLLRNGSQAMQAAEIENPEFTLKIYNDVNKSMVCMEVADNGPGMDNDTRRRVFEPFFTTKAPGVGTGLGLSVSYFIIVENHKGEIEVESKQGAGTRFIVRLPRHSPIEYI